VKEPSFTVYFMAITSLTLHATN